MLENNSVVQSFAKLHNLPHTLVVVCNNIFIQSFLGFHIVVQICLKKKKNVYICGSQSKTLFYENIENLFLDRSLFLGLVGSGTTESELGTRRSCRLSRSTCRQYRDLPYDCSTGAVGADYRRLPAHTENGNAHGHLRCVRRA